MKFVKVEEIEVWQKGRELVRMIYQLTAQGLFAKDWGLRDQIQRAAVSIPSNIAEGYARCGNKEFVKFLWISKGSAAEVQTQLYVAQDLGYITEEQFRVHYDMADQVQAQIYYLIRSLSPDLARKKL